MCNVCDLFFNDERTEVADHKDRPQNLPKGLRPETLGELIRDEQRMDRAFEQMERREQQTRQERRSS